uniref:Secreted protein n=1 Tax=Strongyloides venezuelensis TaxID=75913 RepID=A0A0K0G0G4_STRVS
MSSINLFNCLSLLLVVQGVSSQVLFETNRRPINVHDNYYLAQLKVQEGSFRNKIQNSSAYSQYLKSKVDLMSYHLANSKNISDNLKEEIKNMTTEIKNLEKKIKGEYVKLEKTIGENDSQNNDINNSYKEGFNPQVPHIPKAKRKGQLPSQDSKKPKKTKQTDSYK